MNLSLTLTINPYLFRYFSFSGSRWLTWSTNSLTTMNMDLIKNMCRLWLRLSCLEQRSLRFIIWKLLCKHSTQIYQHSWCLWSRQTGLWLFVAGMTLNMSLHASCKMLSYLHFGVMQKAKWFGFQMNLRNSQTTKYSNIVNIL